MCSDRGGVPKCKDGKVFYVPNCQAGRDNYPYNPKFVGNTGNRTRDLWLDKCKSN